MWIPSSQCRRDTDKQGSAVPYVLKHLCQHVEPDLWMSTKLSLSLPRFTRHINDTSECTCTGNVSIHGLSQDVQETSPESCRLGLMYSRNYRRPMLPTNAVTERVIAHRWTGHDPRSTHHTQPSPALKIGDQLIPSDQWCSTQCLAGIASLCGKPSA